MTTLTRYTLPGGDFSEAGLGRKLPAGDRCLLWHELAGDERRAIRNQAVQGARGQLFATPTGTPAVVGAAAMTGGALMGDVRNDRLQGAGGNFTLMFFFRPGDTGADFSNGGFFGMRGSSGTDYAPGGGFLSGPLRYGVSISSNVFSGDAYAIVFQVGVYNPAAPGADGSAAVIEFIISAVDPTEPVCAILRWNAATRVLSRTVRNGGTFAAPSSASAAPVAAGLTFDTRNTAPLVFVPGSGSLYSGAAFSALLASDEEEAIYQQQKARLAALGVGGF